MLVTDFIVLYTAIWWKFLHSYLNCIATTLKFNISDNHNTRRYLFCVLVHDRFCYFLRCDILWYCHWKSNIVRGCNQYCLSFSLPYWVRSLFSSTWLSVIDAIHHFPSPPLFTCDILYGFSLEEKWSESVDLNMNWSLQLWWFTAAVFVPVFLKTFAFYPKIIHLIG